MPHTDVLIVGAGISGIGVALHLTKNLPNKQYTILENRDDLGGTWDLFKYPGIRSDSDMLTFSFADRPWIEKRVLSPGGLIKQYVDDTAVEYGIKQNIQFRVKVLSANYDSNKKLWTVNALKDGNPITYTANFFVSCTGYYDYEKCHKPEWVGEDKFKGKIIQPQFWPEKVDYEGKKFVVIGSGATAVTLIPSLVKLGAHATMLQRTPTWLISLPLVDWIYFYILRRVLPAKLAYKIGRWRLIMLQWISYWGFQKFPRFASWYLLHLIRGQLKGSGVDPAVHFTPPYAPWDQRLCVVPDNDLFKCLKDHSAEVVTDKISKFDETGIVTVSGKHIEADYIVSATGLSLKFLGGIQFSVDGKKVDSLGETTLYKGVLTPALPNFAVIIGYINQSWTLKVDLAGNYIAQLLKEMEKRNAREVKIDDSSVQVSKEPIMGQLTSGYIVRAAKDMPKQGDKPEFLVDNNYLADRKRLGHPTFTDDYLIFN